MRIQDMKPIESHHFDINDRITIWAFVSLAMVAVMYILWSLP